MGVAARGRATILIDAADEFAAAMAALEGGRLRPRTARSAPEAVDVVASLAPGVVVVAPSAPSQDTEAATLHRAIAERTRWWCEASAVTGAFVVLVSTADVFGPDDSHDGRRVDTRGDRSVGSVLPPDEFSWPTPGDRLGRAWRAAEATVRAAGGAVVRHDPGHDPGHDPDRDPESEHGALAGLVAWVVAGRRRGVWHVGGARLDDLHTRVVRGASEPPGRRAPDES